ncbi:hypothetical protein Q31b_11940 [Novipirellula aureliae]|uniref:Uncharacterized protein n=1 Tax=Novipirellula aureliae TaxID=2527966 RepID=A0A5C6EEN7_9BACT|nr:NfeD family protein [Novipirellula aureliae]TWU46016.1 hypothetical protein Q31b_11940 [Novipirellula aureliae]
MRTELNESGERTRSQWHRRLRPFVFLLFLAGLFTPLPAAAADQDTNEESTRVKEGYLLDIPNPLTSGSVADLLARLGRLSESADENARVTVVLRYPIDSDSGGTIHFEDALRLARAMTQPELRRIRVVSWVQGTVEGHLTLPILASDLLVVSPSAVIADATKDESSADETIEASYQTIAARRGLFPLPVVTALVDSGAELAMVSKADGNEVFASGDELDRLRSSGQVVRETIWSSANAPLRMDANRLRSARIAAGIVESPEALAELLDLAALNSLDRSTSSGDPKGMLLEIVGSINDSRSRRWQSNLSSTLESGDINTWIISIDSPGGNLNQSATLAGWFSDPEPPLQTVAGFVQAEARGDAALIAVSCRPLYMRESARLGGPGAQAIDATDVRRNDELIEQIARTTKRPSALIRGLLDPSLEVYRYTNRKTGRIRYATAEDLRAEEVLRGGDELAGGDEANQDRWQRGERIELGNGLSASEAISLGLADAESASLDDVSRRVGLAEKPPLVSDRGLVRWVERLGRNQGLAFLLLFIGFAALSTEANAPGLGFPGFIAAVCFAIYVWIKFLAGTAEWLELLAFALGLTFIAIEIFVIPGFGVFGVGGLAMTILGIVLMSQTFVLPRNVYQVEVLTHSIWVALGAAIGTVAGFFVIRMMMPHIPVLSGLAMEPPDSQKVNEAEKLGDYAYLLGQNGMTTTPLRPSGKAKFGEATVQVISDGSSIGTGEPVRVFEVHGTRVLVEAVEETPAEQVSREEASDV